MKIFQIAQANNALLGDVEPTHLVNILHNGTRKIEMQNKKHKKPRKCPILGSKKHDSSSGFGCGCYLYVQDNFIFYGCYSGQCKKIIKICDLLSNE